MRRILFSTILILIKTSFELYAQETDTTTIDEVYTIVDEPPEYPGGMAAFYKKIADNLRYPLEARIRHIDGKLYIQFIVDEAGNITEIKTVKGIGGGCDKEAERVVALVGKFIPGKQKGRPVKVRMVMPIVFKLPPYDPKTDADTSLINSTVLFTIVDDSPKFPNGSNGFDQFIRTHSSKKHSLPYQSKRFTVFVQFNVEKDGSTTEYRVVHGSEEVLNNEAIRILKLMPKFSAGLQKGIPVRVRLLCKLTFNLLPEKRLEVTGYIAENTSSGLTVHPDPSQQYTFKYIEDFPPTITKLYWVNRGLEFIPSSIARYQQLWLIDFENNSIRALPPELFSLRKVKQLYLPVNLIDELPDEISLLKQLRILSLSQNRLSNLPASFTQLRKLTALDLGYNQLIEFPEGILSLNKLETLVLAGNQIKNIPEGITEMKNLKTLYFSKNPIDQEEINRIRKIVPQVNIIFD